MCYFENERIGVTIFHVSVLCFSVQLFSILFHLSPCALIQLVLAGEKRRSDTVPKKIVVYHNVNML